MLLCVIWENWNQEPIWKKGYGFEGNTNIDINDAFSTNVWWINVAELGCTGKVF
jgi:hypothetical protein